MNKLSTIESWRDRCQVHQSCNEIRSLLKTLGFPQALQLSDDEILHNARALSGAVARVRHSMAEAKKTLQSFGGLFRPQSKPPKGSQEK